MRSVRLFNVIKMCLELLRYNQSVRYVGYHVDYYEIFDSFSMVELFENAEQLKNFMAMLSIMRMTNTVGLLRAVKIFICYETRRLSAYYDNVEHFGTF
jgi:hypothetical protein